MVANGSPGSADLALLVGQGPDTFPFRRALSLRPLIEFWQGDGTSCEGTVCAALRRIDQADHFGGKHAPFAPLAQGRLFPRRGRPVRATAWSHWPPHYSGTRFVLTIAHPQPGCNARRVILG